MVGSRSLQLDERRQVSRRSFEAWILTSRKVFSEESEWKSESSYWLLKSEDNGSGKMAAHVGGINVVFHACGSKSVRAFTLRTEEGLHSREPGFNFAKSIQAK
ncbi:uncharacterized protein TNCV_1013341 [Trichonephila clavipes]|uniref:Uncharacterized protein n=1 Tax=Trichonephila clavipes TaxID=2585209 RepID=A0A8X7B9J2_TRICX|nr:uncharacterized protein TNCV_1013341 [Trichonephila clavipes]